MASNRNCPNETSFARCITETLPQSDDSFMTAPTESRYSPFVMSGTRNRAMLTRRTTCEAQ